MSPKQVRRLRNRISEPDYYRNRAIETAETYGAVSAELLFLSLKEARGRFVLSFPKNLLERRQKKYYCRMVWYAKKHAEQI